MGEGVQPVVVLLVYLCPVERHDATVGRDGHEPGALGEILGNRVQHVVGVQASSWPSETTEALGGMPVVAIISRAGPGRRPECTAGRGSIQAYRVG